MSVLSTYGEKLKDPRWQKMRLEILQRDNFTCKWCGETEATLHVHHQCYSGTGNPWDTNVDFLDTVCEDCHAVEHAGIPISEMIYVDFIRSAIGQKKNLIRRLNKYLLSYGKTLKNGKALY